MDYSPFDPTSAWPTPTSDARVNGDRVSSDGELGAAAFPALVADFAASGQDRLEHLVQSRDGITGHTVWRGAP
jgi:hypothetical protein